MKGEETFIDLPRYNFTLREYFKAKEEHAVKYPNYQGPLTLRVNEDNNRRKGN